MKALFGAPELPPPEPRRRNRTGDKGCAFRPAARHLFRRVASIPAIAYAKALAWDKLDGFNPWHDWDAADAFEAGESVHYGEPQNHLSPHL